MSLPDWLLEEPDDLYCEEHRCELPCRICRAEAAIERAEAQRKGED